MKVLSPSPQNVGNLPKMQWGDSALTAPTTPGRRIVAVDRSKVDPATIKAAEGMEAMFLDFLMKTMRQTIPKSEMNLESPATEVYRSMLDSETAQKAARAGGVGLADQIIAYLQSQSYTLPTAVQQGAEQVQQNRQAQGRPTSEQLTASTETSTGGTHESRPTGK